MLESINSLTVALAESNVQTNALIRELREVKRDLDIQRQELDSVKAKLYSMSAIIGIAVTVATNWITGKMG